MYIPLPLLCGYRNDTARLALASMAMTGYCDDCIGKIVRLSKLYADVSRLSA